MLTFCWTKKEDDNEQHVYHCLLCFETKIKKTWQAHDSSSSFFVAKQKVKKIMMISYAFIVIFLIIKQTQKIMIMNT